MSRNGSFAIFAVVSIFLVSSFTNCGSNFQRASDLPHVDMSDYLHISDDIVIDKRDLDPQVAQKLADSAHDPSGLQHKASVDLSSISAKRWPNAVIPIVFARNISIAQQTQIYEACAEWSKGGRLRCVPRNPSVHTHYLVVQKSEEGCFAHFGVSSQGYSVMNLSPTLPIGPSSPQGTCWTKGIIMHEFGHVLGLMHEHQRPDRDNYVSIDYANVRNPTAFSKYSTATNLGPYDFLSIMHYTRFSSSSNGRATLLVKPAYSQYANEIGKSVTEKFHLSNQDLKFVSEVYGYGPVQGFTGKIELDNAGNAMIRGWACEKGSTKSLEVRIFAGGPAGTGQRIASAQANVSNEPAVHTACGVKSGSFRYIVKIPPSVVSQHRGKKVHVHGISNYYGSNLQLTNSGTHSIP